MKKTLIFAVLTSIHTAESGAAESLAAQGPERRDSVVIACAGQDDASEVPAFAELNREVGEFLRHYREQEEAIGDGRWRLEVARYHLGSEDFGRRLHDDPEALDEATDILRSCVFKLLRKRIESTALELVVDRFDRVERLHHRGDSNEDADDRLRVRVSPSVRLGHHASVGAKLQLRGAGEGWTRWSLRYRQNLDDDIQAIALQYADGHRIVRLEHVAGDLVRGEQILLNVRWRF
jgi:hypothetical protein